MQLHKWADINEERLNATATRQMIHGATMTIAKLRLSIGAVVPMHSHHNEQITTVESGSLLLITPSARIVVRAGESLCLPPNLPHSVETLEDSVAVDVFSPVREDWVRGDDSYLRR